MLKVLYLLNHAGKAGTETYVRSLAEKLHDRYIKAYFAYNEEGLLVEWLTSMGIETLRLPMKHRLDIKAAWQLSRICRKLDIDIIHTQYQRENYIALMSRIFNPKVRVIYTSHFVIREAFLWRMLNRLLIPLESYIVAVCNPGKKMLISNGYRGDKINVIFNGVDLSMVGDSGLTTFRSELDIDKDVCVLLCMSRFAYDKGHKFLINAIAELKKITTKKFKLVLGNNGPLLEEIKKQVKDMGLENDVIFIGFREDKYNLLFGSDIYINSSRHEALSFAIVEALSAGLPVIATDMGGNSDIINEKTKCGILVKYDDPKGMAEAINRLMEDRQLREELGRNALRAVNEIFNLDKMVMETYNLYMMSCGYEGVSGSNKFTN